LGRDIPAGAADLRALYGVTDQAGLATLLGQALRANNAEWWHGYRDVIPRWFEFCLAVE
jgi:hypothetical protein